MNNELKALIRCIHTEWYGDWMKTPERALKMHQHMSELFNHADIDETLVENNPDKVSPAQFAEHFGIDRRS